MVCPFSRLDESVFSARTVAYIYSGQAARTALAIGLNRSPMKSERLDDRASLLASQTWWYDTVPIPRLLSADIN